MIGRIAGPTRTALLLVDRTLVIWLTFLPRNHRIGSKVSGVDSNDYLYLLHGLNFLIQPSVVCAFNSVH